MFLNILKKTNMLKQKDTVVVSRQDISNIFENVLVNRLDLMVELKKANINMDTKKIREIMPEQWMKVRDVVLAMLAH